MEAIRQKGKIILHGNDGISIKMIFKNLTGRNFQGQEYVEYIRHIAIEDIGLLPSIIEHCRDDEMVGKEEKCLLKNRKSYKVSQLYRISDVD